jgi:zinc D-Ala-D-Ala dipeptidase
VNQPETPVHDPDIILIADPVVAAVPLRECREPLADLRGVLAVDPRRGDPQGLFALARTGVRDRLEQAQTSLPRGIRLLVTEAFRPVGLQRQIHDTYRDELLRTYPGITLDQANTMASRYVAPVGLAPHTCGAAVDLTLCDAAGAELDMGCAEAATPEQSDGACYTNAPTLSPRARENRQLLQTALGGAGLVNYPTEWWHWSYGDRYWALLSGARHAVYGPTHPDPFHAAPGAEPTP